MRVEGQEPRAREETPFFLLSSLNSPLSSILRGQDSNLRTRDSKSRISTDRNYPASKSALRELNPPVQLGRLAPWPLGQEHLRADVVITIGSSCGDRNRTCDVTVNSRLPVPARTPPQAPSGNRTRTSGMASRQAAVTSWAQSLLDRVVKELFSVFGLSVFSKTNSATRNCCDRIPEN